VEVRFLSTAPLSKVGLDFISLSPLSPSPATQTFSHEVIRRVRLFVRRCKR
jgi:hypothetical protein